MTDDEIKITKLPPGRAIGAGDLHSWSTNRMTGRTGSSMNRQREKLWQIHCQQCGCRSRMYLRKDFPRDALKCRRCGGKTLTITKKKWR
jgi:hypothetical protein